MVGGSIQMLMSWAARGVYANPCTEGQVQARRRETHRLDVQGDRCEKLFLGGGL